MTEGVGSFRPIRSVGEFKSLRVDKASSTVLYIGIAAPGASTGAAVWQIKRVTTSAISGAVSIDWADGNTEFDNVWDNRASLTYS